MTSRYEPREHVIDAELANGNRDAWMQALGLTPTSTLEIKPDPTAPTCERCGAKVHDPCPTDEEQAKCELPDFCFPNGR